ncbi:MAG TPA: hypothetical protein ENN29_11320 [Candidatus Hydrogenedentes bacterium]|nr:hypothetical protein [Candidatus Hydrogenedentota bacterium]
MQAIRQTMRAPENRELRIHLPDEIAPNAAIEIIVMYDETQNTRADKINGLKAAMNDELFKHDLKEIASDFASVDMEGWNA